MIENKDYVQKDNCPYCGYSIDSATFTEDDTHKNPEQGDLSFCLMCAGSLEYGEGLKLKKFNLDSITDRNERFRLKQMQKHIHKFWEAHPEDQERRKEAMKNAYQ